MISNRETLMGWRVMCGLVAVALAGGVAAAPAASQNGEGMVAPAPQDATSEREARHRELATRVDELMHATLAEQSVPGAVVAVIDEGELAVLAGYGVSDAGTGAAVDPARTVFHVASLSKHVTAVTVLQLVEQGMLDLHEDVNRYLEGWQIEAPAPVTLHQLMTHTAGLDRGIVGRKVRDPAQLEPLGDFLARKLPPVVRAPGSLSLYSNYGLAVAGHIVETVAGMPFAEYARRNVFEPLGMSSSSFGLDADIERRMATGYGWRGADGEPEPLDYIQTAPASMLRTTAADMARFMLAMLNGGGLDGVRILQPASAELVLSRQHANHPFMLGRSYGLSGGGRFDPPSYLHTGGAAGFSSAILYLPQVKFGIFVSFNSRAFAWDLINALLARFDDRIAHREFPGPMASPPDPEPFAGWYRSADMPRTGPGKLASLIEQTRVDVGEGGGLLWQGQRFEAIDPLAYRSSGGTVIAFGREGDGVQYLYRIGGEYERVAWWESRPVQMALWIGFTLLFVSAALAGMVGRLRSRRAGAPRGPVAQRAGVAACAIHVLFVAAAGAVLGQQMSGGSLEYGLPISVQALFLLPWLAALVTAVAVAGVPATLRDRDLGAGRRIGRVALVAALVVFLPFLAYWNLLGFGS